MRIATAFRFDESVDSLQRRQRDLSESQAAMTNGKRINKPSDDPTGAARAERAFIAQQKIASEQRMIDASRNSLSLGEASLAHAIEQLQSGRETLVAAGNGSYTASERAAQVNHLRNVRAQLLALANQDDGAGGYVFGGQSGQEMPFLDSPGGVITHAAPGQQQLSQREYVPTTLDGGAIWLQAPTGNGVFAAEPGSGNTGTAWVDTGSVVDPAALTGSTYEVVFSVGPGGTTYSVLKDGNATAASGLGYTSGVDIEFDGISLGINGPPADGDRFVVSPSTNSLDPFAALDRAIAALDDPHANDGQVAQAVNSGLRDLDSLLRHFQSARSNVGATLTRLDSVDNRNQDRTLWAQTLQSNVEDIDMVQAVSDFQNKQTGYQAALQSYALVQRMSLLDYVK